MHSASQIQKVLGALALAASAACVSATTINIINQCGSSIELWDNKVVQVMSSGASVTRDLPVGFHGMFRSGVNPQATLAEFAVEGGFLWYDISIIPTGPKSGPEYCPSLQACKDLTGGVGYNIPMQIAPKGCQTVTCMSDGCADAYQYPKDDTKTHACAMSNSVDLTFCPGGAGGGQASTPAPTTQAPTPPPTTQAPTPEPTTQAPTPEPTTQAPTPEPTTQTPTPPPTTQAPTPEPTTQAPTPEPTTQTPTPEPTPEPSVDDELLADRSIDFASSTSGSVGSESVGSGSIDSAGSGSIGSTGSFGSVGSDSTDPSADSESEELESGVLTPTPTEFGSSVLGSVRQNGSSTSAGSATGTSVQAASNSTGRVGGTLIAILAGVACVAGAAVFVTAKKKKQLEEETVEQKDSIYSEEGMLTPIDNIQCI